ncbi:MAG: ATP-grasp domain-containing protein [Acidobacteria bacterium]|nr:ATP-grasp domain-containing protein [Acidobacteriota bacterium]
MTPAGLLTYADTMHKHLLLLATTTGYQTRIFAETAHKLGVRCTLATDRCSRLEDPWGDDAIAVRFQDPAGSVNELLQAHKQRGPFTAIAALGDRTTMLSALFAEQAGIPFHPPHAVEAARNKFLMRERFRAAGLPAPSCARYPVDEDPGKLAHQAAYPCVLKPLGLSGSRGVIRANHPAEFSCAFERIRKLLDDPDIVRMHDEQNRFVQVESYIPGAEFAVEGVLTRGELQVFALFDKPDPLEGPYFEETIYITPSRHPAPARRQMLAAVKRGTEALGLTQGPLHAEVRFNEQGAWLLEIAARPIGGLCAKALRFRNRVTLEEVILRHALGQDVSRMRLTPQASGVMMIPIPKAGIYQDVEGLDQAAATAGIEEILISARKGQKLERFPEAQSYLGFIFARAKSPADVEQTLRQAHARLRFEIATEVARS